MASERSGSPFRSFRERNVRIFFGGLVISAAGTWAQTTALVLLVQDLGGGGLELGLITACQFVPYLLFGLWAGAFGDRIDRFRAILVLQCLLGLQAVALGLIDLVDAESIGLLYVLTLAFGTLSAFDNPIRRTYATELVPADGLANILALSTSVMTGARIVGPALAALAAGAFGTEWVFLANGFSFLAFLGAMALIDRDRLHPIEPAPRSATPVRDGLRAVWDVPELRVILVVFAVVSTFAYNYLVGFPLLVSDRLGRDESLFGVMLSLMSIGNVVGSLAVARLTTVPNRWMFGAATIMAASLAVVAVSTSVALTLVAVTVFGLGSTAFVNSSNIIVQQRSDPRMRGRVLALLTTLFLGSTPIGGPITGAVGDTFGAVWASLYGALISAAAIALGAAVVLRRRMDADRSGLRGVIPTGTR